MSERSTPGIYVVLVLVKIYIWKFRLCFIVKIYHETKPL